MCLEAHKPCYATNAEGVVIKEERAIHTSSLAELNRLEIAALEAIVAQYPELKAELTSQFRAATCVGRRNTGAGFLTDLAVDHRQASPVALRSPIGNVWADVVGFQDPITFLVFMRDGYAMSLEGAAIRDDTSYTDFGQVSFAFRPSGLVGVLEGR